jgi:hypothetical protein
MKTAFLIYKPVLDYEDSEHSYCVCSTRRKAEKIVDECFSLFEKMRDDLGDDITGRSWDYWHEKWKIKKSELFDIYLYYNWERDGRNCLEIREIPFFVEKNAK